MDLVEARGRIITNRHPWERARLSVIKKLVSKYGSLSSQSVVLDIGCGDTYVVENLAMDYPDTLFYAVDIAFTKEMMDNYNKNLKVKNVVLFQSLDEVVRDKQERASLVLLTDVIEHIGDDKKFISGLIQQEIINDKTTFIVTVPAYQCMFCSHDLFLGHYRRYTNKLLKKNLIEAGMQVQRAGYFFFSLLPIRFLQVMKEKFGRVRKENPSTGLVTWSGSKVVAALFKFILIADAEFSFLLRRAGINLPGLSNYAICRKSV